MMRRTLIVNTQLTTRISNFEADMIVWLKISLKLRVRVPYVRNALKILVSGGGRSKIKIYVCTLETDLSTPITRNT